jgi:hypothetical protein
MLPARLFKNFFAGVAGFGWLVRLIFYQT